MDEYLLTPETDEALLDEASPCASCEKHAHGLAESATVQISRHACSTDWSGMELLFELDFDDLPAACPIHDDCHQLFASTIHLLRRLQEH